MVMLLEEVKVKGKYLTEGRYSVSVLPILQRNHFNVFLFMKGTFWNFDPISLPLQNKTALFGILLRPSCSSEDISHG